MTERPMRRQMHIQAGYQITFGKADQLLRINDDSGDLLMWPNGSYKRTVAFIKDEVSFKEFASTLADLNGLGFREFTPSSPKLWGYEFYW